MAVEKIAVGMLTGMSNCKIQNIVKLQEPKNYWIVVKMFPTSPGRGNSWGNGTLVLGNDSGGMAHG